MKINCISCKWSSPNDTACYCHIYGKRYKIENNVVLQKKNKPIDDCQYYWENDKMENKEMNHYLFIKEDYNTFYEFHADSLKKAVLELYGDGADEDTQIFRECVSVFDDNDPRLVSVYNKFVYYDRIKRVILAETIYNNG